MKKLLILLTVCAAIGWSGGAAHTVYADDDVGWLLAQINALRAAHGLSALALNGQLNASATGHSQYLANNIWRDPHVEANGSTPQSRIAAAGYPATATGENVYGGGLATAGIAFNWWVGSPVHLQSMVNPGFSEVGIGVVSGPYGRFFTTDFGDRSGAAAAPPVANPPSGNPAQPIVRVPGPTRRPASPVPTLTPSITWTPSATFTPLPSRTPTTTFTPLPPTSTAMVFEVSPQPNLVANSAQSMAATMTPIMAPTTKPVAVAALPTDSLTTPTTIRAVSNPSADPSAAPSDQPSNGVRTLIPFAIGLQALILGGLALRRGRRL